MKNIKQFIPFIPKAIRLLQHFKRNWDWIDVPAAIRETKGLQAAILSMRWALKTGSQKTSEGQKTGHDSKAKG